ncbi:MAG TPA: AAA family ATPase [Thermoanaerobaculia bacterium]|jgi:predicted ATPase|nr:AAA family ATPase [Thermoanaerobaculia bacterium]
MARNATSNSLFFSSIHLENWRNFVRAELRLQKRIFLVGPNASGKSNFLDIFRFLHDLVSVGGGFQEAVERRGGISSIRALAGRYPSDVVIQVEIATDNAQDGAWRYELSFAQDKQRKPVIKHEAVHKSGAQVFSPRPDSADQKDPERLRQTYLEQTNTNQAFREIAQFFASVEYLHIVPQLVRDTERYVGREHDPFGGDFLEQIVATPEKTRRARLRRIEEALRVAVPQLSEIETDRDNKGRPHIRGKYQHWRPTGAWQNEDQFSDGTLRLMGLLWASLEGTGPLLLEEPELSLHPAVVRFLPQMFARLQRRTKRQIMLSTHSPDLLADPGIGTDEVFLLTPSKEGTTISSAAAFRDVVALLDSGMSMAEAVIPRTEPEGTEQLPLFADR